MKLFRHIILFLSCIGNDNGDNFPDGPHDFIVIIMNTFYYK